MKDLPTLTGPVTDAEGNTHEVTGADFWRSGNEGVASAFTGESGRTRLYLIMQALLPKTTLALAI